MEERGETSKEKVGETERKDKRRESRAKLSKQRNMKPCGSAYGVALAALMLFATSTSALVPGGGLAAETTEPGGNVGGIASDDGSTNNNNYRDADAPGKVLLGLAASSADDGNIRGNEEGKVRPGRKITRKLRSRGYALNWINVY